MCSMERPQRREAGQTPYILELPCDGPETLLHVQNASTFRSAGNLATMRVTRARR